MTDLPTGRELDALVAEKIMGFRYDGHNWGRGSEWWGCNCPNMGKPLPHYSADIAAAWQVVEHLAAQHTVTLMVDALDTQLVILDGDERLNYGIEGTGETMPLAICRAALAAIS